MQELKYLGSCLLDTVIAVVGSVYRLFVPLKVPPLDEYTEAFYHK